MSEGLGVLCEEAQAKLKCLFFLIGIPFPPGAQSKKAIATAVIVRLHPNHGYSRRHTMSSSIHSYFEVRLAYNKVSRKLHIMVLASFYIQNTRKFCASSQQMSLCKYFVIFVIYTLSRYFYKCIMLFQQNSSWNYQIAILMDELLGIAIWPLLCNIS